ncbi:MAG: alpha/beta fold hydrolase [Myxococcota bacterium]|nr:alpha/beta fold hydrolase [Myxococcota bacterium]
MIPAEETFDGTWPFAPKFSTAAGFRQHYVDEGPRDGEVIVCLHGEPTWGYLYRKLIPPLAADYRVVVPDHMGFGKSETPQDREYTLRTHVENLEKLIDDIGLNDITFVVQDWGGPMSGGYTMRNPGRVKRCFLMNTLFGYGGGVNLEEKSPWFQWIEKHEEAGTLQGILGELGSTVLSVMKIIGFQNSAVVNETWIRAYSAPFPDRESCIGAINFPLDVHYQRFLPFLFELMEWGNMEDVKAKPAMLVSGDMDFGISPEQAIADFRGLWPDAPIVETPGVGHFCQEDIPETLVALVQGFMQANP